MARVVAIGDVLDDQPSQWIQLVGNHESQYLPGGTPFWPDQLSGTDAELLRSWWIHGSLQVAAAVSTPDGAEVLFTHAGLTVGAWRELGEPPTASAAARLLNERPALIWRGGEVAVDRSAGPLWAEAGWELYEPWLQFHARGGFVPFGQIHGHSSIARFTDQSWRCPGRVRQRASVDWQARHTRVRIGGRVFTGIDPKHRRTGAPQWQPLVIEDAVVLP